MNSKPEREYLVEVIASSHGWKPVAYVIATSPTEAIKAAAEEVDGRQARAKAVPKPRTAKA